MVQLTCQSGDFRVKNDQKDVITNPESDNFFEKLEKATPTQVSQAIIAKILLKLKKANEHSNLD
jgi:hypothetical protein